LRGTKGAYILLIVSPGVTLTIGRLGTFEIPSGTLGYVGSAMGPGGLGARIERHFRRGKSLRWHVDYLTEVLDVPCAIALPGEGEAPLSRVLWEVGSPVIRGFGCSDRRADRTHLYLLGRDLDGALEILGKVGWRKAYLVWNPYYRSR